MNSVNLTELSQKRLVKLAIRSAKEFIAARGINATTRKGSKELELLIKKITGQSLSDREQATQVGQNVGEKIVELSRQKAKSNLDKGVVRQLAAQKEILSLYVSSTDKILSTHQPREKPSSKAATPVIVSKLVEEVQSAKYFDKKLEEPEREILEEPDEEFEDPDEEFAQDSEEEILEEPDEEFSEESDEDILDENHLELQEDFQEEQPVELSARSEAIAINPSQSTTEKEEEEQKSQEVE